MNAIKKNILILVFHCFCSLVSGTTYYVSSAGNDAADGISESTSWKSITKVNSVFSTFKPGDMVLFKRGDTFYGTITVTASGSSAYPIILGAYGNGESPVISGFTTVTGWTNEGNGIYSKAVTCESAPNMVTVDGTNTPIGRSPDLPSKNGWPISIPTGDTFTSTSMYDLNLAATPNLTGAEIVIRTTQWTVERKTVTHSDHTLIYSATNYLPPSGAGYFIQNHLSTLTRFGEWCYTSGTLFMYFGLNDNPANHTIKISSKNNLINNARNYVTLNDLTLEGANWYGVNVMNASYCIIKNCTIRFGGNCGIYGTTCDYFSIESNTIDNNNDYAIYLTSNCTHSTIKYNSISNTGMILGMGSNGDEAYNSVVSEGDFTTITNNRIEYSGYVGIRWGGQGSQITYNYITYSCQNKADGAGIYSYRDFNTNKLIDHNIILYSSAQPYGWSYQDWTSANGIYQDGACNTTISNNTIGYIQGKGIFVNANQNSTVENNTIYNCPYNIYVFSEPDSRPSGVDGRARGHVIRYNISVTGNYSLHPDNTDKYCIGLITKNSESDLSVFGIINYNYYASPLHLNWYICSEYNAWGGPWKNSNLTQWQTLYGYDTYSSVSLISLTDVNKIRFEYNETNTSKIIALDVGYIDVKGIKYSGSLTLLPYTSVVLFVDPNPSTAPASPGYVSSVIENTTPSMLEMTYDLPLANVVPAASSYVVLVNSVARPVNAVAISGTKVQLTLASPVLYGDIVTVSYTKPSTNPLQTLAGGQAVTISAKSVTNKVNSLILVYVSAVVANVTPKILEIYYDMPLASIVPAASAFLVRVNSVARTVNSVAISGTKVQLTLANPIIYGDIVTVSYTQPAINAIQFTSGLKVANITALAVTNNVYPAGPIYVSSSIENQAPNILEMTYDAILAISVPGISAFTVVVNAVNRTISSVTISGTKVLLTLATPVVYGDKVTVSYLKPARNPLQNVSGETAVSFSSPQTVTNNCIYSAANETKNISIYPNPAREFINISFTEPSSEPQILRIFDFNGRLCLETILDPFINYKQVPINLKTGVYIVQVILGSLTTFAQKLIVN